MILRMLGLMATLGVAAVMICGCSTLDDFGSDNDRDEDRETQAAVLPRDEVVGKEWTVTWMWGADVVENALPTLLLQTDNRLAGLAGVNRFGGQYTLNPQKGRLAFSKMFSTLMAGPENQMAQESAYMDLLGRVTHARISDRGELELMERNDVLIRLEHSSKAAQRLVGAEWTLFRLRGEKLVNGHTGSIEFKDDGSFAGFAGVNRFFGKYTKDNRTGRIELRDIGTTRMAGEERIMRQEERLLASLRAVDHFSFTDDGDLVLRNGSNVAARFKRAK